MSVVFVLLPLALLIGGIGVALFIWAVRSGQFDDLDTPPVRMLFDDEAPACGRRQDGEQSAGRAGAASPAPATARSQTQ